MLTVTSAEERRAPLWETRVGLVYTIRQALPKRPIKLMITTHVAHKVLFRLALMTRVATEPCRTMGFTSDSAATIVGRPWWSLA